MLTADLLQYTRRQGRITPRLLDPANAVLRDGAEAMIELVRAHLGRRRGELEPLLRAFPVEGANQKTSAGLAKLLLERCQFATESPPNLPRGADVSRGEPGAPGGEPAESLEAPAADPIALRQRLFDMAAGAWQDGRWQGGGGPGEIEMRASWLREVGAGYGLSAQAAESGMFGDLAENQRLQAVAAVTPEGLLFRYNTAQVQGLLLQAERMTIEAPWPPPARLRQLFRYLKFFGLLYDESPTRDGLGTSAGLGESGGLGIVVDGPLSVLEGSIRYGRDLASFFPALLLWPQQWRIQAQVRPPRRGSGRRSGRGAPPETSLLEIQPQPKLRSHYPDQGQWVTEEHRKFIADFNRRSAKGSTESTAGWRAEAAEGILSLPGNRVLTPDFQFQHPGKAGVVYLEHLPHPDGERAARLLHQAAAAGRKDYWVACKGTPAVKERVGEHPRLIAYRRGLLPGVVLEALETDR